MSVYTPSASRKQTTSAIPDRIELSDRVINPLYEHSIGVLNQEEQQFRSFSVARHSSK